MDPRLQNANLDPNPPNPIEKRIQSVDDQKLKKKKTQLKAFDLFLIKNCDLLCPSYRRSLHSSKGTSSTI
jgi:hypothetical protein